MSASDPTVGELFVAKSVTNEHVNAAVQAYLANHETDVHPIADGYSLDLAATFAGYRWAGEVIASPEATPALRQAATRTAILLARAQKA
ncbi:hypothetical protein MEX01_45750 [Methylorubrum extorquens]|uniref:hypothetical protein n=1 Tax=Methylorubrum extorquens TaxID=408 RepID=UPI001166A241|nr:hypothetical protein [Methylorubrum extorquens]GEL43984.1 hypothetical protein MEX01_45750 [Methylorubrum extorquens]